MEPFKRVELFGGAMAVDVPENFIDVSNIRQVPDHQEVYLDAAGDTSICIDILEYVNPNSSDHAHALHYHLSDIDERTTASALRNCTLHVALSRIRDPTAALSTSVQVPQPPQRANWARGQPIAIHALLVRLQPYGTDILVTVNMPDGDDQKGQRYLERIIDTLEIRDYGLFGQQ